MGFSTSGRSFRCCPQLRQCWLEVKIRLAGRRKWEANSLPVLLGLAARDARSFSGEFSIDSGGSESCLFPFSSLLFATKPREITPTTLSYQVCCATLLQLLQAVGLFQQNLLMNDQPDDFSQCWAELHRSANQSCY